MSEHATAGSVHKVGSSATTAGVHDAGYPHGHLGHLTDGEQESLAQFKAFLEEKGAYKPGSPPSHDDQTLL